MKLLPDTFHMNIEGRNLAGAVQIAGDRLGYVHIADSNRRAPEQGQVNFAEVIDALDQIGYGGPLVAEGHADSPRLRRGAQAGVERILVTHSVVQREPGVARLLLALGVSRNDIETMVKHNRAWFLGQAEEWAPS